MPRKDETIAQQARNAFEKWHSYWQQNINTYNEMTEFIQGRQWDEDEEAMFKTNKKVPLQFNKLNTLCNSVIGEQQQNTPQLQVVPMENCDESTGNIRELVVKHTVLGSDAKTAYQVAAKQGIVGGFGAYLIDTGYVSDKSFEVDIIVRSLKDPTRCYWSIDADHISKIDSSDSGYLERMSRKKFRQIYGKKMESEVSSAEGIQQSEADISLATDPSSLSSVFAWSDAEAITINHYYQRKAIKKKIYKLSDGSSVDKAELEEIIEKSKEINRELMQERMYGMGEMAGIEQEEGMIPESEDMAMEADDEEMEYEDFESDVQTLWHQGEMIRIEDSKIIDTFKVMHYVVAGDYILEDSEFPASLSPVIFMDQDSYYDKNGKQITRPFTIDAKDAQRFINYLGTQAAYTLKVSRYDQFIASKKNVSSNDTQTIWRDPTVVQGALIYDESPSGARPEQLRPPEISQSLLTQYQRAMDDLYTSTGLYPARLGQQGNEVSGAAVDARTRQGSYSTYNVFTSINRAIAAGGQVINDMIPRVYDTERVITLMHPEEGQKSITLNKQLDEYGSQIENDIRKGTYQVRLMPGPSYEGQKDEALKSLQLAIQNSPEIFPMIADLYAENLPLANTIEIKNRLKTIVPPQVIEAGKTGKSIQELGNGQPDPQQEMMQKQAQLAEMEIQLKQRELDLKEQELLLRAQTEQAQLEQDLEKIRTERLQAAGALEEQKLRYMAETERTQSDSQIAHANNIMQILTHKL